MLYIRMRSFSFAFALYQIKYKTKTTVKKKHLTLRFSSCMIHKVSEMEKIVRQTLLYDFYGELLTSHQKKIYEDAVFGDLSLSEIAQEQGISRQGVHDLIRRCDRIMEEYEGKLQLIRKFSETKEQVEKIRSLAVAGASAKEAGEHFTQIGQICDRILETL